MTHRLQDYRRVLGSVVAVVALALAACALTPMSQTVAPGSTIMVPVSGERVIGGVGYGETPVGFASPGATAAISDPERGSIFAVMCPSGSVTTLLDCQARSDKVTLTVRYVTRVYPDPASKAAIENLVDDFPAWMTKVPMSGQVLLFVDIPASLNSIFGTCTGASPPASCFATYSYSLFLGVHLPSGADDVNSLLTASERRVTVVRGTGIQNTNGVVFGNIVPNLERYVPYPKCVFVVSASAENQVAGGDLTITLPAGITVRDVIEEEHLGRHTMLRWRQVDSTTLAVSLVSPEKQVNRIAVVFELNSGTAQVAYTAFGVSSAVLYNDLGNPLTGTFTAAVIR